MADKLRSVNTRFWDDPFVEELSPSEKLLFLYLLTNPQTNLIGIYELTIKRITFDTGLTKETVSNGLERFAKASKAFYRGNYIILPNWLKNQRLNSNMKIAVMREFDVLPKDLKDSILGNGSEGLPNDSKGFERVRECLGKYEIEVERESEDENEDEDKINFSVLFHEFKETYPGTKRDSETEFENMVKKHKDWREVVPQLNDILVKQIAHRKKKADKGEFVPEWKHLKTWINQRCWEEEIVGDKPSPPTPEYLRRGFIEVDVPEPRRNKL